jgi:hypothetical protein
MFEDRMLLLANNPTVDDVKIDVIDIKNDKVAGSLCIELTQLLSQDSYCMMNQTFNLYTKNKGAKGTITLSMSLRYLHHSEAVVKTLSQGLQEKKSPDFMAHANKDESLTEIFGMKRTDEQEFNTDSEHHIEVKASDIPETNPAILAFSKNKSEDTIHGYAKEKEADHIKNLRTSVKDITDLVNSNGVNPIPRKNETHMQNGNGNHFLRKEGMLNGSQSLPRQGSIKKRHNSRAASKKDSRPKVYLTLKFNKATSVISLVVHKAVNLQETSHTALPSPYVKSYLIETLLATNKRDIHSKKKTKTKKSCLNPIFEETLEYFIPSYNLKHHRIEVNLVFCLLCRK